MPIRVALLEPDQAGNVGAAIRLCACLGAPLDLIEPFGSPYDERRLRRGGLDYLELATVTRVSGYAPWAEGVRRRGGRVLLLTTRATAPYLGHAFSPDDALLFGSESRGAPPAVHADADLRLTIPMIAGRRSLNLVTAVAMTLGEALRQRGLPDDGPPAAPPPDAAERGPPPRTG